MAIMVTEESFGRAMTAQFSNLYLNAVSLRAGGRQGGAALEAVAGEGGGVGWSGWVVGGRVWEVRVRG